MDFLSSQLFDALAAAKAALDAAAAAYDQSRRLQNTLSSLELVLFMIPRDEKSRAVISKVLDGRKVESDNSNVSKELKDGWVAGFNSAKQAINKRLKKEQESKPEHRVSRSQVAPETKADGGSAQEQLGAKERPAMLLKQYIIRHSTNLTQLQSTMFGLECTVQLIVELLEEIATTLAQVKRPRTIWLCMPWKLYKQDALKGEMDDHELALKDHIAILQSAISVASFCVQKESFESTFDSSAELTDPELRQFWRRKIGRDKMRVSRDEFGECFVAHVFHNTEPRDLQEASSAAPQDAESVSLRRDFFIQHRGDPCIFLRRLASMFFSPAMEDGTNASDMISVFDVQQRSKSLSVGSYASRSAFDQCLDFSMAVMDKLLRNFEFTVLSDAGFNTNLGKTSGTSVQRFRVRKLEPLQVFLNTWWSSAFAYSAEIDGITLVRFDVRGADLDGMLLGTGTEDEDIDWTSIPVKECSEWNYLPMTACYRSFEAANPMDIFDLRLGFTQQFSVKAPGWYAFRISVRTLDGKLSSYLGCRHVIHVVDEMWTSICLPQQQVLLRQERLTSQLARLRPETVPASSKFGVFDVQDSLQTSSSELQVPRVRCESLKTPLNLHIKAYLPESVRRVFKTCKLMHEQTYISKFWPPATVEEVDVAEQTRTSDSQVINVDFTFDVKTMNGKPVLGSVWKYFVQLDRDAADKRFQFLDSAKVAPKLPLLVDCTVDLPSTLVVRLDDVPTLDFSRYMVDIQNTTPSGSVSAQSVVRFLTLDAITVRSSVPVPQSIDFFFYEVRLGKSDTFVQKEKSGRFPLYIGMITRKESYEVMPGWEGMSFAYSVADGAFLSGYDTSRPYQLLDWPTAGAGDVVGVAVDRVNLQAYFTVNGCMIGNHSLVPEGKEDLRSMLQSVDWYPAVGSNIAQATADIRWLSANHIGSRLQIPAEQFLQDHPQFDKSRLSGKQRCGLWKGSFSCTAANGESKHFSPSLVLHIDSNGIVRGQSLHGDVSLDGSLDANGSAHVKFVAYSSTIYNLVGSYTEDDICASLHFECDSGDSEESESHVVLHMSHDFVSC